MLSSSSPLMALRCVMFSSLFPCSHLTKWSISLPPEDDCRYRKRFLCRLKMHKQGLGEKYHALEHEVYSFKCYFAALSKLTFKKHFAYPYYMSSVKFLVICCCLCDLQSFIYLLHLPQSFSFFLSLLPSFLCQCNIIKLKA